MINRSNRETALTGIHAGVGIGAVLEQQLRDVQVIRTAGLEQRPSIGSRILGRVRIGAVFE
jgi:hypothetical protein